MRIIDTAANRIDKGFTFMEFVCTVAVQMDCNKINNRTRNTLSIPDMKKMPWMLRVRIFEGYFSPATLERLSGKHFLYILSTFFCLATRLTLNFTYIDAQPLLEHCYTYLEPLLCVIQCLAQPLGYPSLSRVTSPACRFL